MNCPVCDRADCPCFPRGRWHPPSQEAADECQAHAVDWRTEALTSREVLSQAQRELDVTRDALVQAVKAGDLVRARLDAVEVERDVAHADIDRMIAENELLSEERDAALAEVERVKAELAAMQERGDLQMARAVEAEHALHPLSAELAALRERERWVLHTEANPNEGETVQVWRLWSNDTESVSDVVYRRGMYCDLSLAGDGDFPARVTHWRRHPSRPEGLPWEYPPQTSESKEGK